MLSEGVLHQLAAEFWFVALWKQLQVRERDHLGHQVMAASKASKEYGGRMKVSTNPISREESR